MAPKNNTFKANDLVQFRAGRSFRKLTIIEASIRDDDILYVYEEGSKQKFRGEARGDDLEPYIPPPEPAFEYEYLINNLCRLLQHEGVLWQETTPDILRQMMVCEGWGDTADDYSNLHLKQLKDWSIHMEYPMS